MDVTEAELQDLYLWVDEIPLSRPKRNIARDFSDGVLMAEVVHQVFPKLVDLHNYSSANATVQKMYNWNTLNQKVFKRMGFTLSKQEFEAVCNCQPGAVERVLKLVRTRIDRCKEEGFTGVVASPVMVPAGAAVVSTRLSVGSHPAIAAPAPKEAYQAPQPAPVARQPIIAAQPKPAKAQPVQHVPAAAVPVELLADRDQVVAELRETNEILETKVRKLEQLVRLKDAKIATLMARLQSANLA